MKLLIVFGLILFVEFSQQIPVNQNDRKILPIKEERKVNKISEILFTGNPITKDDAIDKEQVSPRKRISRIGKISPYKNLEIQSIKNDEKEKSKEEFVLNDEDLVDLIVDEASENLNGLTEDHDSDNAQQRQKRGWFKKIWRSAEKRTKESIPAVAGAAVIGLFG